MSCQGLNSSKDGHFTTSLCNPETYYSTNVWWFGCWGFFCLVLMWDILCFFICPCYLSTCHWILQGRVWLSHGHTSLCALTRYWHMGAIFHLKPFLLQAECSQLPQPLLWKMLWSLNCLSGSLLACHGLTPATQAPHSCLVAPPPAGSGRELMV